MTPSERIAAEIGARISAGRLATGDRVPSARQIARDWGVAIATATRVLGRLKDEGLVRAVPGVGTVVAGVPVKAEARRLSTSDGSRRPVPAASPTRERIAQTA